MEWEFAAVAVEWRGPSPFVFVPIPDSISAEIKSISSRATYGWGCIPVQATIGDTIFTTSLMPRNGIYMVPLKVVVQKAEKLGVGDLVPVKIEIAVKG